METESPTSRPAERDSKFSICNIFDVEFASLIKGLTILSYGHFDKWSNPLKYEDTNQTSENVKELLPDEEYAIADARSCTTCGVNFNSRSEQVNHFKLDWHRYNLKMKLSGGKNLSEEEFERTLGSRSSSSSSVRSSSDDEDDFSFESERYIEENAKLYFRSSEDKIICLYKCLLLQKKCEISSLQFSELVQKLPKSSKWCILIVGGGHFAGAVFKEKEILLHKTIHRYTTRAKQGTSQGVKDKKQGGSQPKSAGANLRRYNEQALQNDIQDVLKIWQNEISTCDVIFFSASNSNQYLFFGKISPLLKKDDSRIKKIPFATKKPTFKEVQRIHLKLTTVECYDTCDIEEIKLISIKLMQKRAAAKKEELNKLQQQSPKNKKHLSRKKLHSSSPSESDGSAHNRSHQGDPYFEHENSGESDQENEMFAEMESVDFTHLKDFDHYFEPKHKRKQAGNTLRGHIRDRLFTTCKMGDYSGLQNLIQSLIDEQFSKIRTASATEPCAESNATNVCDKKTEIISKVLVSECSGGFKRIFEIPLLNGTYGYKKTTLLHEASKCGHSLVVQLLLQFGADPSLIDSDQIAPYSYASDSKTKVAFRRFMAENEDVCNFDNSKIPGPLYEEEERLREIHKKEKRRLQKQNRKERMKEKKAKDIIQQQDNTEKNSFLSLNDSEKIKCVESSSSTASRCFECGAKIDGVPFEYSNFKFCSVKCVTSHRQKCPS